METEAFLEGAARLLTGRSAHVQAQQRQLPAQAVGPVALERIVLGFSFQHPTRGEERQHPAAHLREQSLELLLRGRWQRDEGRLRREDPVRQQRVKVGRQLQRAAEALHEGDGARLPCAHAPAPCAPALQREDGAQEECEHLREKPRVARERQADCEGKGQRPLPPRHVG
ncbi:hypothetical protein IR215_06810 [Simulacricoccus sp. 17bor-14]|nr:hypothetical protein [Simulacricoccus sp. 17bor-14]